MGDVIELKTLAERLAEKLNYNDVTISINEDEFSASIDGTDIKVCFWQENTVTFEFVDTCIVLPRDIFQGWISAIDEIGNSDGQFSWPEELDIPIAEYKED